MVKHVNFLRNQILSIISKYGSQWVWQFLILLSPILLICTWWCIAHVSWYFFFPPSSSIDMVSLNVYFFILFFSIIWGIFKFILVNLLDFHAMCLWLAHFVKVCLLELTRFSLCPSLFTILVCHLEASNLLSAMTLVTWYVWFNGFASPRFMSSLVCYLILLVFVDWSTHGHWLVCCFLLSLNILTTISWK